MEEIRLYYDKEAYEYNEYNEYNKYNEYEKYILMLNTKDDKKVFSFYSKNGKFYDYRNIDVLDRLYLLENIRFRKIDNGIDLYHLILSYLADIEDLNKNNKKCIANRCVTLWEDLQKQEYNLDDNYDNYDNYKE